MRLDGKVALITGAARGQGAAEARLFAAHGARVVLADLDGPEGVALAAEIGGMFLPLDVTSESDWQAAIAAIEAAHGRLDVLVNNAGILRRARIEDTDLALFNATVAVNQTGVFLGMKAAVWLMKPTGGSIVNVSSTAGLRGAPEHLAYCASKFAVRGMTKVAAIEFAPYGIRVNSVHPGLIETPMLDPFLDGAAMSAFTERQLVNRAGTPDEVAQMVLFLASDASSYSTGVEFICDGGLTTGSR